MVSILIVLVRLIAQVLSILIIVDAILSFFMSPFHPVRVAIGRIVNPMLSPIRKIVPPIAMMDFSPLILLIIINVLESILINLLSTLR
jgi:YggT family protein